MIVVEVAIAGPRGLNTARLVLDTGVALTTVIPPIAESIDDSAVEETAKWGADATREEVTDFLVSRMQVASLLQWIRAAWPMADDAGRADIVFVHPVEFNERDPLVRVPPADLLPAQELRRLRRRAGVRFAHGSSLLSLAMRGKYSSPISTPLRSQRRRPSTSNARSIDHATRFWRLRCHPIDPRSLIPDLLTYPSCQEVWIHSGKTPRESLDRARPWRDRYAQIGHYFTGGITLPLPHLPRLVMTDEIRELFRDRR